MVGRKVYTKEFKEDAVRLYRSSGKSYREIAADLGISPSILGKWDKDMDNENAFPGQGNPRDKEIYELKKEIANLKEERDILKKAMAIFSQHQK